MLHLAGVQPMLLDILDDLANRRADLYLIIEQLWLAVVAGLSVVEDV